MQYVVTGAISFVSFFGTTLRRHYGQLLRQRQFSVLDVAASTADCCGSSNFSLLYHITSRPALRFGTARVGRIVTDINVVISDRSH